MGGNVDDGLDMGLGVLVGAGVDDGLDVGLGAAVGTRMDVGSGVSVGAGASVGVTSLTSATGVGSPCPPPQPAANRIDAIPAISRPTFNSFISYPRLCESPTCYGNPT